MYICDECIDLCNEIIDEELTAPTTIDFDNLPKPREINEIFNDYVRRPGARPKRIAGRGRSTTTTSACQAPCTARREPTCRAAEEQRPS